MTQLVLVLGNPASGSVPVAELLLTDLLSVNRQQRATKSPAPGHRGNAASPAPAASITSMVSTWCTVRLSAVTSW